MPSNTSRSPHRRPRRPRLERLEDRTLPSLLAAINSPAGSRPASVVTGDFDGGGKTDVAVTDIFTGNVDVLLGKGDGTFAAPVGYPAGINAPSDNQAQGLAVGDFRGNGKLDLVTANYNGDDISVLLGNGDGTFQTAVHYALGFIADGVVVGDFRGDGKLDIAVAGFSSGKVAVLLGNGDGTFQSPIFAAAGSNPNSLTVGDFNHDGKLDIATANGNDQSVDVLLGHGDGTFATPVAYPTAGPPDSVTTADLRGDGKLDLIVTGGASSTLQIFPGNGDGTFGTPTSYATDNLPRRVAVADFGGGLPDLAVSNEDGSTVTVFHNTGGGAFAPGVTYAVDSGSMSIATADFTGDGHTDLVTANFSGADVSVLLGNGDGTFRGGREVPAGNAPPYGIVRADLTNDGKTDLVVTNRTGDAVSVLLGHGDGTFAAPLTFSTGPGSAPEGLAVGDLTGKGIPDVVTADAGSNDISVLLGRGDGTFAAPVHYPVGAHPDSVVLGDFNHDGTLDIAVTNNLSNTISVLLGNGDGTFRTAVSFPTDGEPDSVAAADLNGDGKLDLAVTCSTGNVVDVLLGNGDGSFRPAVGYAAGNFPDSVAVADFNEDGKPDLVTSSYGDGTVSVFLGNGDGTFRPRIAHGAIAPSTSVAVADFNGDGHADVLVGSLFDAAVALLPGNGDGTFQAPQLFDAGPQPAFVVAGDFTGDGRPDVAAADSGGFGVTVLLSQSAGTAASRLTDNLPNSAGAGQPVSVTVNALDGSGNPAAGYRGTVHFTSTDGAALLPPDYTFTAADAGSHTFSLTLNTLGARTVTVTDTANASLTVTGNVDVVPYVQSLTLSGPAEAAAGTSATFTVSATDFTGAPAGLYRGTVHFTSTDGAALLPPDYTFTGADAGSHTFDLTLNALGGRTVTVTDTATSSLTDTADVTVVPNAQRLNLSPFGQVVTGLPTVVTVSATDLAGRLAPLYRGTVHFTSTDLAALLPPDYTFTTADGGSHTFGLTLNRAGPVTVFVADGSLVGQAGATVVPYLQALTLSGPTRAAAGLPVSFTLTAVDYTGNPAGLYRGTVHFTSTDGAALLPPDYTFTAADAGRHTFGLTLNTLGGVTVSATDTAPGGLTALAAVTVFPYLRQLTVSAPAQAISGLPAAFTVGAVDYTGAPATLYRGTVHFTSTDPAASLPTDYTFTVADAGSHTFTFFPGTAGGVTITASDAAGPGADGSATVAVYDAIARPNSQFPVTLALAAPPPASGAWHYTASVAGDNPLFDLEQQYGFAGVGYAFAAVPAYVLRATTGDNVYGNPYYLLRPSDGGLFPYDGSGLYNNTTTATPIAVLGADVFAEPSLLTDAQPPVDYAALYAVQQQYQFSAVGLHTAGVTAYVLHSNQPGPGVMGYYLLRPSDGALFPYDGSGSYNNTKTGTPLAVLGATVYADPAVLVNAEAPSALYAQLYQVNRQYDLQEYNGSFYTNNLGHQAQWLYSPTPNQYGEPWYTLTLSPDGTQALLRAWAGYPDSTVGDVVATLDPGVYGNPAWLADATAPPDVAGTVGVDAAGNLSVGLLQSNSVGTFLMTVTASDGPDSTSQTVHVTATEPAPTITVRQGSVTLPAGTSQTFPHGSFPQTYAVSTTAGGAGAVTVGAAVSGYSPLFALEQQYRFQGLGYHTAGVPACVLRASGNNAFGNPYYLLRPDGGLFAYDGSGTYFYATAGTPIATLGAAAYADPTLLTGAKAPVDYATLYAVQRQYQFTSLGLHTAGATALVLQSATGNNSFGNPMYLVRPSDGGLFPYDGSGNYNNTTSGTPLASLGVDVVVDPSLLLDARAEPGLYARLVQAEAQYDFAAVGFNVAGAPAYVLRAALNNANGNPYYLLRSDGTVWAYDGSGSYAPTFANAADRVLSLDPSVYADPTLLTTAKAPPAATGVTASLSGGVLTVSSPASFVGSFRVTLTATDGVSTATQSFFVTATDTPPVPSAVADQSASASGPPLRLALAAADAEGDPVTYAAQAAGYSAAYALQQQYHFQGLGFFTAADGVTAYVLRVSGANADGNPYYLLRSDGGVYAYDGSGSYAQTFADSANLVATLDPSAYADPTLLTAAKAPAAPAAAVSVSGNALTVDAAGLAPGTVFEVFVTASDGALASRTSFRVSVTA